MFDNLEKGIITGDPLDLWAKRPEEWKEYKLWDIAEYINGRAFKPTDFSPIGLPVIKITELKYGMSSSISLYDGEYEGNYLLKMVICFLHGLVTRKLHLMLLGGKVERLY